MELDKTSNTWTEILTESLVIAFFFSREKSYMEMNLKYGKILLKVRTNIF